MKPRFTTSSTQVAPAQSAKSIGLRYVSDGSGGIRRLKAGQGFRYVDERGRAISEERTLKRIRSLAIPPAWTDVWICPSDNGHLQATGRDARKRKQYRYHPLWRDVRDATKYDRMIDFAKALPRIRQAVARDLKRKGLVREKVFATIVRLMDLAYIRVGNEEYARTNNSYGLTTLKDQHAKVNGETVQLSFRGKSGKYHKIAVEDARLARIVKHCQDIPGQDLFQFYGGDGARHDVTSGDVNEYLRHVTGSDFSAKDFRTWAGTVLATQALQACAEFETQRQAKKNIKAAIHAVAEKLGNTPAVCRKCYIHPSVLDGYAKKKLPCPAAVAVIRNGARHGAVKNDSKPMRTLGTDEQAVLQFLECCRREEQARTRRLKPQLARLPEAWRGTAVKPGRS